MPAQPAFEPFWGVLRPSRLHEPGPAGHDVPVERGGQARAALRVVSQTTRMDIEDYRRLSANAVSQGCVDGFSPGNGALRR